MSSIKKFKNYMRGDHSISYEIGFEVAYKCHLHCSLQTSLMMRWPLAIMKSVSAEE